MSMQWSTGVAAGKVSILRVINAFELLVVSALADLKGEDHEIDEGHGDQNYS